MRLIWLLIFAIFSPLPSKCCVTLTRRPSSIMLMSKPQPRALSYDDQIMWANLMPQYMNRANSQVGNGLFPPPVMPIATTPAMSSNYRGSGAKYSNAIAAIPIDLDLPAGVYKIQNARVASPETVGPLPNPVAPVAASNQNIISNQFPQGPQNVFMAHPPFHQPVETAREYELWEARKMATKATYDPNEVLKPGHVYQGHIAGTRKILSVVTRLPVRHNHKHQTVNTQKWWTTRFSDGTYAHEDEDGDDWLPMSTKPGIITRTMGPPTTETIARPRQPSCGYSKYSVTDALFGSSTPTTPSAVGEALVSKPNEFPWQVWISLQHQELTLFGSAAVINDWWLLASGSFIRLANDMTDSIVPLFGLHDAEHVSFSKTEGVFSVPVAGVEFHPILDFALIKLQNSLNLTALDKWYRVQPVCLPSSCDSDEICGLPGQTAWLTGWHYHLEEGGNLKKIKAAISPLGTCENTFGKAWVSKDMVCIEGPDVCSLGYSGQLVSRFPNGNSKTFALCGLATAQDCQTKRAGNRLGIFTRVCAALDWIRAISGATTPNINDYEVRY